VSVAPADAAPVPPTMPPTKPEEEIKTASEKVDVPLVSPTKPGEDTRTASEKADAPLVSPAKAEVKKEEGGEGIKTASERADGSATRPFVVTVSRPARRRGRGPFTRSPTRYAQPIFGIGFCSRSCVVRPHLSAQSGPLESSGHDLLDRLPPSGSQEGAPVLPCGPRFPPPPPLIP
jgi:hypothetical protein